MIYCFGVWEPNLTVFLQHRFSKSHDRLFVDVGANVGYFTLLVAKASDKSKIISIEAVPSICKRLQSNITINGFNNITVLNCAATESSRSVDMYYGGLEGEGLSSARARKGVTPVSVDGKTLSSIIPKDKISKVKIIKIDTEGHEYEVILGLVEILSDLPEDAEIIVEVSPDDSEQMVEIFSIFSEHGFHRYYIPNLYKIRAYAKPTPYQAPIRLRNLPKNQTDIVFSRVDADFLI